MTQKRGDDHTDRPVAAARMQQRNAAALSTFSSSRFTVPLNAALLSMALVVCGLAALTLWRSHAEHEARALVTTQNISRLLVQDLDASFDKVDLALLAVKDEVEPAMAAGAVDAAALSDHIARHVARQPDLAALRVTDAKGEIKFGTGITPQTRFSSEQRGFFQKLRDDPNPGLVISEPIVGQVSGRWSLALARRISAPDNSFAGIVYGIVLLEDFQRRFAALDLGAHGAVSLRDLELGTVVRYPEPKNIGSAVGNRTFSKEWPEKLKQDPDSGTYFAVGLDGRRRALAYHRVTDYPFYVIVGLFPGDYLEPWTREVWKTIGGVALFSLISFLLARMLRGAWRQREADSKRLLELTRNALLRSEDRLQLALDRADLGLWMFAPGDGSCSATAQARSLHGLSRNDPDTLDAMLRHVVPEDRARVEVAVQSAVETEPSDIEFQLSLANGESRWLAWTIRWVPEGPGHPAHVVVLLQDVSQRIRTEQQLRTDHRRKDEFLATLSHELRNPLAPIRTSFEIMRRSRDPNTIEKARGVIDRQLAHLFRLVDDLLDVSRITQGKMRLRKERLNIAAVVQAALETSRPLFEVGAHQLTVKLPDEPVMVDADLTRLAQVFSNLLNNAARYTPAGGHVWVTISASTHDVAIEVKDDGAGIPADELPHVFEMFAQGDRSVERTQGGLGIGLSLVKQLVEMHGGTVESHSAGQGQGSSFVVTLAKAPSELAAQVQPDDAPTWPVVTPVLKTLAVVDDGDDPKRLALLLELLGHHVVSVANGREALEAAKTFHPNVVFLDMAMRGMNGYELARRLRSLEGGHNMVLVGLAGWGEDQDLLELREAGIDHQLVKPASLSKIRRLLEDTSIVAMHGLDKALGQKGS
jgi:PAS domain S-box-containing protein